MTGTPQTGDAGHALMTTSGGQGPPTSGPAEDRATRRADLTGRADLDALLRDFYRLALADPILKPVFVDVMRLDLDRHLPVVGAFWEHVLFRTGTYGGRTMDAHRRVHERVPLTEVHFDRWLALWERSVDAGFAGPFAEQAKAQANRMAAVFLRNLRRPTERRSLPLAPARR